MVSAEQWRSCKEGDDEKSQERQGRDWVGLDEPFVIPLGKTR